jgi:isomerase DpgB
MVTRQQANGHGPHHGQGAGELALSIDGSHPLSPDAVAALVAVCDRAEERAGQDAVIVRVSGAPGPAWARGLTVALVNKWERAVRRLERVAAATIGVADGDCGGLALDALLATDYRIAAPSVRLLVPVAAEATWPGMGLYRLAHQTGAAIRRAVLFGAPIVAVEALALHLVDEVTDDLVGAQAAAAGLAGAFCGTELAIRRQLMHDAPTASFEDLLGVHLAACDRALRRVGEGETP